MIDSEIQAQLVKLESETVSFLTEHREQLDALAQAVMKQETLSANDVDEILSRIEERKRA